MNTLREIERRKNRKQNNQRSRVVTKEYTTRFKKLWHRKCAINQQKRRSDIKEHLAKLKSLPCMDCNKQYNPWQMHYDHRNAKTKIASISTLVGRGCHISFILSEIKKCDLVCANCHANRTYKRFHKI